MRTAAALVGFLSLACSLETEGLTELADSGGGWVAEADCGDGPLELPVGHPRAVGDWSCATGSPGYTSDGAELLVTCSRDGQSVSVRTLCPGGTRQWSRLDLGGCYVDLDCVP